jgi:hypothetical protein
LSFLSLVEWLENNRLHAGRKFYFIESLRAC